jgi:hypothetical protein
MSCIDLVINVTREWDDFTFGSLPSSTCPVYEPAPLAPGANCVLITHELLDTDEFVFFGRAR